LVDAAVAPAAAVALYAPTLYFVPDTARTLSLVVLLFLGSRLRVRRVDVLLFAAVALAMLNVLASAADFDAEIHLSSLGVLLWPVVAVLARRLDSRIARWLLLLTMLESAAVIWEFVTGTQFISASHARVVQEAGLSIYSTPGSDLLYFRRPFGLSANSSLAAQKLLLGVVLLLVCSLHRVWRIAALLVLLAGIVLTFNRTVLIAVVVFGLSIALIRVTAVPSVGRVLAIAAMVGAVVPVGAFYYNAIRQQVTRGEETLSLTGRGALYRVAWEHINDDPLRGTSSLTFRTSSHDRLPAHLTGSQLHNSYLMLLVQHGIVIAALVLGYIALQVNSRNWILLLPLAVYCLGQHGLFWAVSYFDIIFYYVLSLGPGGRELLDANSSGERALSSSAAAIGLADAPR
jgi:O-antigen ligase